MLERHQRVVIFEDPVTRTRCEGRAQIITVLRRPDDGGLGRASVLFDGDCDAVERWVSIYDVLGVETPERR